MSLVPNILLIMVLLPLIGAALVMASAPFGLHLVRRMTLVNVLISMVLAVVMVVQYNPTPTLEGGGAGSLLQMASEVPWLSSSEGGPQIRFTLAVDGLSLWLVALTALLMLPAVLVSWEAIQDRAAAFYALLLVLQAGMVGVFTAQDIILFYVFFEFTLIPLFFLIGIWGGYDRRWAARKFFVYTFAGSMLTFLALVSLVLVHQWMSPGQSGPLTFSIPQLMHDLPRFAAATPQNHDFFIRVSPWIFAGLFAGFAIKVPLFPFHTWLPLAHVEAPTAGSVLLAGVLLKIGSYGFIRFGLSLVPEASILHFSIIGWLSVIGIVYGALLSLAQDDIKKLIAYSSVSHMGFCMLGLFSMNPVGLTGGMLQMINHGLSTGALFSLVGMLYERYHTRDIEAFGGLAKKFPIMASFFVLVSFSSIGLPGLNGFTGEILSLMGMFRENVSMALWSLTGIILGAWYMLWLVRRIMFGRLREPPVEHGHGHHHSEIRDLKPREILALAPVCVLIVAIGVFPQFFISRMEPSIRQVAYGLQQGRKSLSQPAQQVAAQPAPAVAAKSPRNR